MVKKKQVFNNKLQRFKNAYVHGGKRELCVQKITKYIIIIIIIIIITLI